MHPIIDLHCDLLSYLALNPKCTPHDLCARCAISQLREGNVKLQVMAAFTKTEPGALQEGLNQIRIYQELALHYSKDFTPFTESFSPFESAAAPITTLLAIENASGVFDEKESFDIGLKRLNHIIDHIAPLFYISLTWNSENRFGGGAHSQIGLKEDGKLLLEQLHQRKVAVDLSHASDALACEIIDFIESQNLDIPLLASHSNARAIVDVPRNLPDEIAREIFRRKGVIGMNFYYPFVGNTEDYFLKHLSHWLEIGGEDHIALGADFFYEGDLFSKNQQDKKNYFDQFQNASCYSRLLQMAKKELGLSDLLLDKFAHRNFLNCFDEKWQLSFTL